MVSKKLGVNISFWGGPKRDGAKYVYAEPYVWDNINDLDVCRKCEIAHEYLQEWVLQVTVGGKGRGRIWSPALRNGECALAHL